MVGAARKNVARRMAQYGKVMGAVGGQEWGAFCDAAAVKRALAELEESERKRPMSWRCGWIETGSQSRDRLQVRSGGE